MSHSVAKTTFTSQEAAASLLGEVQSVVQNCVHISMALAIATTKTKVKAAAATYYTINDVLCTKAITDNLWTLSGTVTNAKYNVFVLTLNASGTATATMGTEGASLAAVVWPTVPSDEVVVGYVVVNPTGTGNFVGGTTDLDDGTVVPNAVYVNTPFPFNPNFSTL